MLTEVWLNPGVSMTLSDLKYSTDLIKRELRAKTVGSLRGQRGRSPLGPLPSPGEDDGEQWGGHRDCEGAIRPLRPHLMHPATSVIEGGRKGHLDCRGNGQPAG